MEPEINLPIPLPEDEPLMKLFGAWQLKEEPPVDAIEVRTGQVNRQKMNKQKQTWAHENIQQGMSTSKARYRSLRSCYSQAQQACVQKNDELQEERQRHEITRQNLEIEIKARNRTEQELEHHYSSQNRIWQILTEVPMSSRDDKAAKIANLEHKLHIAREEYRCSTSSHQEAVQMKHMEIAELEGRQAHSTSARPQEEKKAKTNPKRPTPKTKIPRKSKI